MVRIPVLRAKGFLRVEVFYSKSNNWRELDLSCHPEKFIQEHKESISDDLLPVVGLSNAIAHDGILYWLSNYGYIIAYNPYR